MNRNQARFLLILKYTPVSVLSLPEYQLQWSLLKFPLHRKQLAVFFIKHIVLTYLSR